MLGVITKEEAISLAQAAGVDLVCISPDADPPVCRLVDYSKFRYEQARGTRERGGGLLGAAGPLALANHLRPILRRKGARACRLYLRSRRPDGEPGAPSPIRRSLLQEKKAAEVKKKMAAAKQELKELKMSYKIDTHDYDVRLRAAKKFLSKGDRVKVVCLLKGREVEFKSIALEMFNRFLDDTKEDGSVDGKPMMEGARRRHAEAPVSAPRSEEAMAAV